MKTFIAPADENPHENRALARFAAVQWIAQALRSGLSLTRALALAAEQPWDGQNYTAATLESWFYRYRHGQFSALHDRPRSDKGTQKALDPAATEALIQLRRLHPQLTLKTLANQLLAQGLLLPGAFSLSTLQRRLAQAGLDKRTLKAGGGLSAGGPTKAFELPLPNMLWMADCMHGPTLQLSDRSSLRTYLFALLDDCSRLCPHAQFYPQERVECFLDTFRHALQTRGLPDKLYTDNGPAFRSHHLKIVCANLEIKILHTRPYCAWSKGKLERFFLTAQKQFQQALVFQPVHDLEQLNLRFWQWLEKDYHQREHSSLQGQSPAQRFATGAKTLRSLPPDADLDRLFLMRVNRRVRKDATFSLAGQLWEVASSLRGQIICVHYDPIHFSRVDVYLGTHHLGRAVRCNKQLNSRLFSRNDNEPNQF
jgi:putative transposase